MGLYDRDYVRDDEPQARSFAERPRTVQLIAITVGVFILDMLFDHKIRDYGVLTTSSSDPWNLPRLLSHAFLHADVMHLLFNMIGLYSFGTAVEARLGRDELLRLYLAAAVFGGAVWFVVHQVTGVPAALLGASGAVNAVAVLFAWYYPHAQILLMGIIPLKAWVASALFIGIDLLGFLGNHGSTIAHEAHLAGAALGLAYGYWGWNFGRLGAKSLRQRIMKSRANLRVFQEPLSSHELTARADEILRKIAEHGEASLTDGERKILIEASRHYQQRRS